MPIHRFAILVVLLLVSDRAECGQIPPLIDKNECRRISQELNATDWQADRILSTYEVYFRQARVHELEWTSLLGEHTACSDVMPQTLPEAQCVRSHVAARQRVAAEADLLDGQFFRDLLAIMGPTEEAQVERLRQRRTRDRLSADPWVREWLKPYLRVDVRELVDTAGLGDDITVSEHEVLAGYEERLTSLLGQLVLSVADARIRWLRQAPERSSDEYVSLWTEQMETAWKLVETIGVLHWETTEALFAAMPADSRYNLRRAYIQAAFTGLDYDLAGQIAFVEAMANDGEQDGDTGGQLRQLLSSYKYSFGELTDRMIDRSLKRHLSYADVGNARITFRDQGPYLADAIELERRRWRLSRSFVASANALIGPDVAEQWRRSRTASIATSPEDHSAEHIFPHLQSFVVAGIPRQAFERWLERLGAPPDVSRQFRRLFEDYEGDFLRLRDDGTDELAAFKIATVVRDTFEGRRRAFASADDIPAAFAALADLNTQLLDLNDSLITKLRQEMQTSEQVVLWRLLRALAALEATRAIPTSALSFSEERSQLFAEWTSQRSRADSDGLLELYAIESLTACGEPAAVLAEYAESIVSLTHASLMTTNRAWQEIALSVATIRALPRASEAAVRERMKARRAAVLAMEADRNNKGAACQEILAAIEDLGATHGGDVALCIEDLRRRVNDASFGHSYVDAQWFFDFTGLLRESAELSQDQRTNIEELVLKAIVEIENGRNETARRLRPDGSDTVEHALDVGLVRARLDAVSVLRRQATEVLGIYHHRIVKLLSPAQREHLGVSE